MILRRHRLAAVLLCTFPLAACAQSKPPQLNMGSRQQSDALQLVLAQEHAWNDGDLASFTKAYKDSPETLFIGRQLTRGYAQILADYKHNYPSKDALGALSYTNLEAHPLDDKFTLVVGLYHLERNKKYGGNADGVFSLLLEKTDQGWKIILDNTAG
jgi:hypothetical protein